MIINKLSEIAVSKRMNIAEISRITGIGYSVIQRLYNDKVKSVEIETINKLCNALECTPSELFKFTPDNFL
ncbi:MAG: helix-turn-helix transcriptional regulator [Candidatus Gastranaerophilales bacterium]|nr:helix-turn-helix transcriptional regulator [Candidatus Gastranaerophilales bacterium]